MISWNGCEKHCRPKTSRLPENQVVEIVPEIGMYVASAGPEVFILLLVPEGIIRRNSI